MARGRLTVAACGIAVAVLSAGCAPQVHSSAAPPAAMPLRLALADNAHLPDTSSKAKEVVVARAVLAAKADVVAAGPALLDAPSATSARCPAEMALVEDRVCVDRWEATIVERIPGGERAWSPFLAIDGHESSVRAVSRSGVVPQAYISGDQAARACHASGKRLCRADEWEAACRGPSHTTFPYGNERRAGACNDDIRSMHPVAEIAQLLSVKRDDMWRDTMNSPLINQLEGGLLPSGERQFCTNDYGVYDMVGNLHEWIDDPDGTFRGGFYMDTTKNGDGCSYGTQAHDFTYHDYSTGFRCCLSADPIE
ncbi:MAG: SUMF1/EgtB/PvdO family nonheme iron enzyme [Polyangiaceae bacterium]